MTFATKFLSLSVALATSTSLFAATYEIQRVTTINDTYGTFQHSVSCILKPDSVIHASKINGIVSEQVTPFKTDAAKVQAAVDAVESLASYTNGAVKKSTNWLVRSNPESAFKLVRTNTEFANGYHDVRNAAGPGEFLSVYEGVNCVRVFGE